MNVSVSASEDRPEGNGPTHGRLAVARKHISKRRLETIRLVDLLGIASDPGTWRPENAETGGKGQPGLRVA